MTILEISNDPLTVGPAGTREDLERYARNLSAHLTERFGHRVDVRLASRLGVRCFGDGTSETDAAIEAYVDDLASGDGWLAFIGGAS